MKVGINNQGSLVIANVPGASVKSRNGVPCAESSPRDTATIKIRGLCGVARRVELARSQSGQKSTRHHLALPAQGLQNRLRTAVSATLECGAGSARSYTVLAD